jgi:hypothetical protein
MSVESTIENLLGEIHGSSLIETFSDYLGTRVYAVELVDNQWQVYVNRSAMEEALENLSYDDSIMIMEWEV